jgi:hypothetical protein
MTVLMCWCLDDFVLICWRVDDLLCWCERVNDIAINAPKISDKLLCTSGHRARTVCQRINAVVSANISTRNTLPHQHYHQYNASTCQSHQHINTNTTSTNYTSTNVTKFNTHRTKLKTTDTHAQTYWRSHRHTRTNRLGLTDTHTHTHTQDTTSGLQKTAPEQKCRTSYWRDSPGDRLTTSAITICSICNEPKVTNTSYLNFTTSNDFSHR